MKRLIQVLCSVLFATNMSFPVDAFANSVEDLNDSVDEQVSRFSADDSYHMALVAGDFGVQHPRTSRTGQTGSPLIFVHDANGRVVKDAQVVTTIIAPDGTQAMSRAWPYNGGYLVFTNHLLPGRYRVETEVVTDGMLLTREFIFMNA